jgi:hypothetical protein
MFHESTLSRKAEMKDRKTKTRSNNNVVLQVYRSLRIPTKSRFEELDQERYPEIDTSIEVYRR